jgi:hypothetical protein
VVRLTSSYALLCSSFDNQPARSDGNGIADLGGRLDSASVRSLDWGHVVAACASDLAIEMSAGPAIAGEDVANNLPTSSEMFEQIGKRGRSQ